MRRQQTKSRKRHEGMQIGERCIDKGKVIFPSFERADKAARQMTWKMRGVTGEVAKPYVCPYCDQWHIGRGPKGLDALLVGMTEANRHNEVDTGRAVGNEFPNDPRFMNRRG